MKKTVILIIAFALCTLALNAQKKFNFKFYGFVRGDLFYNSRANADSFDGVFQLYPLDILPDANGKDLNAKPNSGFFMMTTRLGVNIAGPQILGAQSYATVEGDFAGFSSSHTMIRLRQANIRLEWESGSSLLVGQTWHPLFGEVIPCVMNVSTGAPFQPFSRTPQLRYRYRFGKFSVMGAALYQYQFMSNGPDGKSLKYSKDAVIPEFFAGLDYKTANLLLTAGVDLLTIRPRTQSTVGDNTYKVDEILTTPSFMVAGSYNKGLFSVAAKSVYGQNLNQVTFNGGYGVSHIDPSDGKYEYTPFKTITSWLNATYGKKYQGGIFLGHSKNLGTTKPLVAADKIYGQGFDIDTHLYAAGQFSYNIPSLTIGLEYALNTAYYGDMALSSGKINNTHAVTNHRLLLMVSYFF